jgi:hypothetical protein
MKGPAKTYEIGRFPIDLQGYGPDKRGPFRCFGLLYIKGFRALKAGCFPEGCPSG